MSWLTDIVPPKIRALVQKRDVPDDLWHKCRKCEQMIFHRELNNNLKVCPHCGHHMRMNASERLKMLFDDGEYRSVELPDVPSDPLKFKDTKKYTDRLKDYRGRTGNQDAIVVAHGQMGGMGAVVAAFDFDFMGGSMGVGVGEALITAAKLAVMQQVPLIAIPSSGGARMQEGILSLMQLPRSVVAVEEVKEAGLPYLVVLSDPTTGGVSASFAMLGDIALSEPGAVIGFAGRRVIEETIRAKLPDNFQKAEYLYEKGMVDIVVERKELKEKLTTLMSLLTQPKPAGQVFQIGKS